jgi:hypothetical protein
MSSPSHRRQRSSQSSTPKRSSRASRAPPSSPPDAAAAQLHSEAASSQNNGTPRRGVPSSSPMNYRSSPADIARMNRERDVSSPLRQMTNTQTTQEDRETTPRASGAGLLGGMYMRFNGEFMHANCRQNHLPFDMNQVPALDLVIAIRVCTRRFQVTAVVYSFDPREVLSVLVPRSIIQEEEISIPIMSIPLVPDDVFSWMRMVALCGIFQLIHPRRLPSRT